MNKEYSRRNRRKKKEYVKELELKVEELQKKVEVLTDQIFKYRQKLNLIVIGGENDYNDFKDTGEYIKTGFKDLLENWNDDKWQEKYDNLVEKFGPTGEFRQSLIKNSIKSVIYNILPDGMKYLMLLTSHSTKKITAKMYERLLKMSKPSALDQLKGDKYEEADRILYGNNSGSKMKMFICNHHDEIERIKARITNIFNDLLKIFDVILNVQDEWTEIYRNLKIEMEPKDLANMILSIKNTDADEKLDILKICNINYSFDVCSAKEETKEETLTSY